MLNLLGSKELVVRVERMIQKKQPSPSSIQNLEETGFGNDMSFPGPGLSLPVFEVVTRISLYLRRLDEFQFEASGIVVDDYSYSVLPRGASFSRNFPRLSSLRLDWRGFLPEMDVRLVLWRKYFPFEDVASSVKDIWIEKRLPANWIPRLCKMFPEMENLHLKYRS